MIRYASIIVSLLLFAVPLTGAQDIVYPAPSGPYQVGSTYRFWIDESRPEAGTTDPDDKRGVLVRFWYPAEVQPDAEPLPALPMADTQIPALSRDMGRLAAVLEAVAALDSYAYLDAPVADTDAPLPVVLFSHGSFGLPDLHSLQFEALASHGYVMAATYHGYAATAVFPDGRTVTYQSTVPQSAVNDQLLVLDQLAALNTDDPDGLFTGRLQTDRVALVGYSFGGQVADKICRTDARCAAYVTMDGTAVSSAMLPEPGAAMFMSSDGDLMEFPFSRWGGPAYSLVYTTFGHGSFMDAALWAGDEVIEVGLGDARGFEAVQMINAYLLAFFDTYLKGEPSPLLDGPSEDYPDVEFESRNTE